MRTRSIGGLLLAVTLAAAGFCAAATTPLIRALPSPATHAPDPGPEFVLGADDAQRNGTQFDWVDVMAVGSSTRYRLYFDRKNDSNYHFVQRDDERIVLGYTEEGVEQVLDEAALPQGLPAELRVARHGTRIGVFAGPRLLAWAFDDRRMGGSVGYRNAGGGNLSVTAQRRDDIRFTDDFMREEKHTDTSAWRKAGAGNSQFSIKSLRNPLLSANAFNYMGLGNPAMSLTGETWWDNYRFETSLRGPAAGKIGVVFSYHDENNYGLFRWTARPLGPEGETTGPGLRELVRVRNGQEEILFQSPYGYVPNQWYRVVTLVTHARVRLEVDGHAFFEVHDPFLAAGAVGVWCDVTPPNSLAPDPKSTNLKFNSLWKLMNQHAVFDDVRVGTLDSFEDDFRSAGPIRQGWMAGLGEWGVHAPKDGEAGELRASALPGPSKCLVGDRRWGQYRLACDVDPGSGSGGLVFLYRDEANHYVARTDGAQLELVRVAGGQEELLRTEKLKVPRERWTEPHFIRLGIMTKEGYLRVTASDGTVVEALDTEDLLRGRAGLYAAPGTTARGDLPARFHRLRLMFLDEPEPLVTTNAIFEDEETMRDWTNASKEWQLQQTSLKIDDQSVVPLWHSNQFPGDVELIVEPRQITDERHELALSVSKDGKGSHNGYIFLYQGGRKTRDGKPSAILKMVRAGETQKERVLKGDEIRGLSSLSLRRVGPFLVGKINGEPELVYRDPKPLHGAKIAYYAKGVEVRAESSRIVSDHFLNELFSSAPVRWRTAGHAIAEVTNRWQCDPRWSFFSLKNELGKGKTAVLWSKNIYPGDVMVEFFVGNKMESERGQPYYSRARDINITICGDGQNLNKGYTILWGGYGNRATYLLRNGKEVKRVEGRVPNEQRLVHRAWMSVRFEKRGNKISFYADRLPGHAPIHLVYEDPQPLSGDRVGLWTYDHAIMLSRVRITGDGGLQQESPDQDFKAPRNIYEP